jgi:hypothetical protein
MALVIDDSTVVPHSPQNLAVGSNKLEQLTQGVFCSRVNELVIRFITLVSYQILLVKIRLRWIAVGITASNSGWISLFEEIPGTEAHSQRPETLLGMNLQYIHVPTMAT